MTTQTGANALTMEFENGKRVFPCRCGKIHRGEYACYDYGHHNCFHETELLGLPAGKNKIQAICPDCGQSWLIEVEE